MERGTKTRGIQGLTKVVGAGPELGDPEPGGSSRNQQDFLIAQRAPPVSEVPRDEATGRIITPTDSTAIWTPARAEDPITARALGESGVRQGLPEARHHLQPWPGRLGVFGSPRVLTFALQVRLVVSLSAPPFPASLWEAWMGLRSSTLDSAQPCLAGKNFPLCNLSLVFCHCDDEQGDSVCVPVAVINIASLPMCTPRPPSPDSVRPHRCLGLQADTGSRPGPFRCDGHRSGSHGDGSSVHSAGNPELRDRVEGWLAGVPGRRLTEKEPRALRAAWLALY